MANPTRKDAETAAKKKRTSTRRTKKETAPEGTTTTTTTSAPTTGTTTPSTGKTSTRTTSSTGKTSTRTTKKSTVTSSGVVSQGSGVNPGGLTKSIQVLDIQGIAAGDSYATLPGVPEMSKKDALAIQTQLARQQNALDVRYERAKTVRKGIKVATEEQNAVTDAVNFQSAVVGTETAVLNYQSAVTDRDIAGSKFEQKQEQLIQQQNSTATTIAMTPLLQEENELNLTKQELKNDKLRLDIEQTRNDLALKQNELDAMVIDI